MSVLRARLLLVVLAVTAGCNQDAPGTSVRIALAYPGELALDTAEVTLGRTTKSTAISHELLLLVPDDLDGQTVPLEVWGKSHDQRIAHGVTTVMPVRDQTVAAALEITVCAPRCEGDMLMGCGAPVSCDQGCSVDGAPHCITTTLSNGIDATLADAVTDATTIAMDATFDTDTGAITDGLSRAPVQGLDAGIGYYQAEPASTGGAPLGIFVFHDLTVAAQVTIRFTGTRGAVLLVGDAATIDGTIDVSGGAGGAQTAPGPGGGAGQSDTRVAGGGCGPGGPGGHAGVEDGGGGGGGGSQPGGEGGRRPVNGTAGPSCLSLVLEPLAGGSGGGRGGPGSTATAAGGGGGGGALQLTALGRIEISGIINAGGAGGEAGAKTTSDAGGGGGGGAGGGILLESPTILVLGGAVLAANGGGGGGGGGDSDIPAAGSNGGLSTIDVASGGGGGEPLGNGGTGGGPSPADFGSDGLTNAGGGGGGGGVIMIRGDSVMVMGLTSPTANRDRLHAPH
jgi:hypothetical protein